MAKKVGIEIQVDSKGAVKSFKNLGIEGAKATKDIESGVKDVNTSLLSLKNIGIAGAVAGFISLGKETLDLADQYKRFNSQIRLVIDNEKDLASVNAELLQVANETRQDIGSTIELYTKLDRATKGLLLTDKEVIDITKTLNQAFVISGASAEEASNGVRQLSQAIQGGILRAEEYNSIIEQTPRIAELFASSLGVTQGEFRKLVNEGKVTSEQLIEAIRTQSEEIQKEFGKVEATGDQLWTQLTNTAGSYITKLEEVNKFQSATNAIIEFATGLFKSLDEAKTLEIAKKTDIENRSLEQQAIILKDLNDQLKGRDATYKAVEDRINNQIELETKNLELIKQRTEEEAKKSSTESNKNKLDQERKNAQLTLDLREELRLLEEQRLIEWNQKQVDLETERWQKQKEIDERQLKERKELNEELLKDQINRVKKEQKLREMSDKQQMQNNIAIADQSITLAKEVGLNNKVIALADITLNTAKGIMSALGSTPPNPILAGIIGATGAVQFSKATGVKFADGGFVEGSGTNRSDSVDARLSTGEFVVNSQGTRDNRELLEAINSGQTPSNSLSITVNAGVGTDGNALAQTIVNEIRRAEILGLEPSIA